MQNPTGLKQTDKLISLLSQSLRLPKNTASTIKEGSTYRWYFLLSLHSFIAAE
jgi:hypothetical protein